MARLTPWLLLALLGCERNRLRPTLGEVEVSTAALHFPLTFLGHPSTQSLTLRNGSRSDRAITLATRGPFHAGAELVIPGGAQGVLQIAFEPGDLGPATGTLTLTESAHTVMVALDGLGAAVPDCPSTACATRTFDPSRGVCAESFTADGTDCTASEACFVSARCQSGACVGSSRDCSDANRCTVDACESGGGCSHFATACKAPSDPCKVASCDPALGCVESDAEDGTPCGKIDCVIAEVCMLGKCQKLPAPEGAICAPASACQEKGVCHAQKCDQPASGELEEAWHYDFHGRHFGFEGVTDALENLFWVECSDPAPFHCEFVSYTRDGALRFRENIGVTPTPEAPRHLRVGDHFVVLMADSAVSYSTVTGAREWVFATVIGAPDVADSAAVTSLAADSSGQVFATLFRSQHVGTSVAPRQSALVKFDGATGAVAATRFFPGYLTRLVLDEHDNLYLGVGGPVVVSGAPPKLLAISAGGVDRWFTGVVGNDSAPLAAFNGEVVLENGEVRSGADGSLVAPGNLGMVVHNALMTVPSRTLLHDPLRQVCYGCVCVEGNCGVPTHDEIRAIGIPRGGNQPQWNLPVATSGGDSDFHRLVSDSALGARGDVLVAGTIGTNTSVLQALTPSGTRRFSCPLTSAFAAADLADFSSPVALLTERWAVVESCPTCVTNPRLRVFKVPGQSPATHGWVGARGGPSGGSHALP